MVKIGFSSSLTLLCLAASSVHHASAFPSLIVNSCARSLQVGEMIMGKAVAPSSDAPEDQRHVIDVQSATDSSACGQTVEQGQPLELNVDSDLSSAVAAAGWSPGIGPNYIVEATNALIISEDEDDILGCDSTRIVNPVASTVVYPLASGQVVVRLLSAYSQNSGLPQVWASQECAITVTGSRTVAQHAGFLVDNASWQADMTALSTTPYQLTVQQILAGASSGFSVLDRKDDGTFAVKYTIDSSDASKVTDLLNTLGSNTTDIQVSLTGFESSDGKTADVLSLTRCTSTSTCAGFFVIPTDAVSLAEGLIVESSVVDEAEGTVTATITSNDESWFGVGFSTPGGGMNGGGSGSDIFVCSEAGLQRFLVTAKSNPASTAASTETIVTDAPDAETVKNLCVFEDGKGRMVFTRGLNDAPRRIVKGQPQAVIWARGNEKALASKHQKNRRGDVNLDFTNLEAGVSSGEKQEAPWILWCHIVFMSLSWGICLPLAVVIASRTRNVPGGSPSAWFTWHKGLARIGWTLQTMGALFGVYYCEVYTDHTQYEHTKLGFFVILAGFLQPLSALVRTHPPKEGWPNGKPPVSRTLFEVYHKGVGWTAIVCGMVNIFLGVRLVKDLDFEEITANVPISLGSIGLAVSVLFFALCMVMNDNPISKALTGANKTSTKQEMFNKETPHSSSLGYGQ